MLSSLTAATGFGVRVFIIEGAPFHNAWVSPTANDIVPLRGTWLRLRRAALRLLFHEMAQERSELAAHAAEFRQPLLLRAL